MTYSEEVLTQIHMVATKVKLNLFEATAYYCESLKIDPADLFNSLDDYAKEQIKTAAGTGRHIRQKFVTKVSNALV